MPKQKLTLNPERKRQTAARPGRPSTAMAGKVDERLLDAATKVFMDHGYEGATFEKIAQTAGSGKATIYARYSGKEELFTDVMRRSIDKSLKFIEDVPLNIPFKERLTLTAEAILQNCLTTEVVSLMRVIIAETPRFPALARLADKIGRQHAVDLIAQVIMTPHEEAMLRKSISKMQVRAKADQFLHLVFAGMQLRALMGESLSALRKEIPEHISASVKLFADYLAHEFSIHLLAADNKIGGI
jgi:AcrR family transcriptional regulator